MEIIKIEVMAWLTLLGLAFGSFACCQAWRIHRKLEKQKSPRRSICMHCGCQLKWYDNIPVISWLILRGKCRKCKKKIGVMEILSEILMGAAFLMVGLNFWDEIVANEGPGILGVIAKMALALALIVVFGILAVYDAKWQELPTKLLVASNVIAAVFFVVSAAMGGWKIDILDIVISIGVLPGIYYLLYFFSREKLVGSGDWILCFAIALALADWQMAIFELFLSNLIALIVSAPAALTKKQRQVAFGPFLIIAFVLVRFAMEPFVHFF